MARTGARGASCQLCAERGEQQSCVVRIHGGGSTTPIVSHPNANFFTMAAPSRSASLLPCSFRVHAGTRAGMHACRSAATHG
eukprot:5476393-Pleurochrysis_carterae.AAC.3